MDYLNQVYEEIWTFLENVWIVGRMSWSLFSPVEKFYAYLFIFLCVLFSIL